MTGLRNFNSTSLQCRWTPRCVPAEDGRRTPLAGAPVRRSPDFCPRTKVWAAPHERHLCLPHGHSEPPAPRARGDDPYLDLVEAGLMSCSPRRRGWSLGEQALARTVNLLPTHVGTSWQRAPVVRGRRWMRGVDFCPRTKVGPANRRSTGPETLMAPTGSFPSGPSVCGAPDFCPRTKVGAVAASSPGCSPAAARSVPRAARPTCGAGSPHRPPSGPARRPGPGPCRGPGAG